MTTFAEQHEFRVLKAAKDALRENRALNEEEAYMLGRWIADVDAWLWCLHALADEWQNGDWFEFSEHDWNRVAGWVDPMSSWAQTAEMTKQERRGNWGETQSIPQAEVSGEKPVLYVSPRAARFLGRDFLAEFASRIGGEIKIGPMPEAVEQAIDTAAPPPDLDGTQLPEDMGTWVLHPECVRKPGEPYPDVA